MCSENANPHLVARRLLAARQARGVTQAEAAAHLGCSRPTFIAIEKGTRRPTSEEIVRLAAFYGRAVHELVRPGGITADLMPHFRRGIGKSIGDMDEFTDVILMLQRFADDYAQLEDITGSRLPLDYPPEVDLSFGDVESLAQDTADTERRRLDLGDRPALGLPDLLEEEVGLRVFCAPLPPRMAGLFAFIEDFGGIVAVNEQHPPEHRRSTIACEYGHLIADRYRPKVEYVTPRRKGKPRPVRFAESFAMHFLMPATSLRRHFREINKPKGDFSVADICRLSRLYFVSVEAMTLRLAALGLIPGGTQDRLRESGFRVEKVKRVVGLRQRESDEMRFSSRYVSLAVRGYLAAEISEEQLADFLWCDRVSAREIVEAYSTSNDVSTDGESLVASYDPRISVLSHGGK